MLAADPTVRAMVIREGLRVLGYRDGVSILKDHLAPGRDEAAGIEASIPGRMLSHDR